MSARTRELFALIPASLLVTAGFTAVFIQRNDILSNLSLSYGAIFLALCFAAHLVRIEIAVRAFAHAPRDVDVKR